MREVTYSLHTVCEQFDGNKKLLAFQKSRHTALGERERKNVRESSLVSGAKRRFAASEYTGNVCEVVTRLVGFQLEANERLGISVEK